MTKEHSDPPLSGGLTGLASHQSENINQEGRLTTANLSLQVAGYQNLPMKDFSCMYVTF